MHHYDIYITHIYKKYIVHLILKNRMAPSTGKEVPNASLTVKLVSNGERVVPDATHAVASILDFRARRQFDNKIGVQW